LDNNGQARFASKEATALDGGAPAAGGTNWFAPFLSFRTSRPTITITSFALNRTPLGGTQLILNWTGGAGPYTIEKKTALTDAEAWTIEATGVVGTTGTIMISGGSGFYRVERPMTTRRAGRSTLLR
jgi:hypothetical protein